MVDIGGAGPALVGAVDTPGVVLETVDDLVGQRHGLHPSDGLHQLVLVAAGAVRGNVCMCVLFLMRGKKRKSERRGGEREKEGTLTR